MDDLNQNIPPKAARRIIFHALTLTLSLMGAVLLSQNQTLHRLLEFSSGSSLVVSAVVSGFFFVSVFTTAIATVSLFILGQNHHPLIVSSLAALGSVIGDVLILKIIRDDIIKDLEVLARPLKNRGAFLFQSKLLHKPLVILAALIIASPLPDELGITILGLIKFKPKNFLLLSFLLNFAGILAVTSLPSLF